MPTSTERAVLAGGCFWGMQDLIRRFPGVISTRVGYTGGEVPNATYRNHGSHAEAIEITFDPAKISYRRLLEFFSRSTIRRPGTDRAMTSARATAPRSFSPTTSKSAWRSTPSPTLRPQAYGRARW
jgi:peptide-methionine (S)-S-oxide reductase